MSESSKPQPEERRISVKEFFESVPPGQRVAIDQMGLLVQRQYGKHWQLQIPSIELHCAFESCGGIRFFDVTDEEHLEPKKLREHFTTFVCKNCGRTRKTYAFRSLLSGDGVNGELHKFGEDPPFGPPTPARVITLVGPERDYYLKGRRSENQGLGIAAFAYYRRVIENQKNRIFDEIIRVAQKIGAQTELITDLTAAKQEVQFSKAVGTIKHAIPQALLINGHNPILLLHSALSEGLHAQTDSECLELATSIRVVLTELAERLAAALKEEAELNAAVGRLLRVASPKVNGTNGG